MMQYPAQLKRIEAHIRRRLRARIVSQQKRRRHLYNKLIKLGVNRRRAAKTVYSNSKTWVLSHTKALEQAFSIEWFTKQMRQKIFSDKNLPGWFGIEEWVKLT